MLVLLVACSALGGKLFTGFRRENGSAGNSSERRVPVSNFPEVVFMVSSRLGKSGFGFLLAGVRPVEMPRSLVIERLVDALVVVIVHPPGKRSMAGH